MRLRMQPRRRAAKTAMTTSSSTIPSLEVERLIAYSDRFDELCKETAKSPKRPHHKTPHAHRAGRRHLHRCPHDSHGRRLHDE